MKKVRILFVLMGLGILATVSIVFGMMMAVSQNLPAVYNFALYKASKNSEVFDAAGAPIGTLTSDQNKILLSAGQISPNVKNAVVAIEDQRYYDHRGVDFRGIGRALVQDVLSLSASQGASTITQQFVKNALTAQGNRTVLQKFREAALAYRLEQHWSKDKVLTEYLNTIYFGEGAYGIEAAARTFFGSAHPGCGTATEPCASVLEPWEAALLAGVIASPAAYSPTANPESSLQRRNLVLDRMHEQGYITTGQLQEGRRQALPAPDDITSPEIDSEAPYFTTWVRQQLVDRYGAARAYFGGLQIKTTLDLELQRAAQQAVASYLGGIAPTAAAVVIDNNTAGVKAMVGGPNFEEKPFNLATNGHRQPGSSIKPFILTTALNQGVSSASVYESAPQVFEFGRRGKELFEVNNYEDSYLGSASLATATTYSDNAVYAQVGLESIDGGTREIARTIHRMGVKTRLSTNPAMVLGGLKTGITPLEWTYAFSTLANDGDRVSGTLAATPGNGPVAYTAVRDSEGRLIKSGDNDSTHRRVLDPDVASEAKSILHTVVSSGTGANADIGDSSQWGKTGTTENNGDAWYCGATDEVTACVWVGYADSTTPMTTEYAGGPVDGGTFPALIWASIVSAWEEIAAQRAADRASEKPDSDEGDSSGVETETVPAPDAGSSYESRSDDGDGGGPPPAAPSAPPPPAPESPPARSAPPPTPATPAPPPAPGGGVSGGTGGASPG